MSNFIKLLSLALALLMLVDGMVACNEEKPADETVGGVTDGQTEEATVEVPSFEETGILTVFANGEYLLKIIRSEYARDMDTNAYAQLRNAFARKTGASASMATDFVAANEEKRGVQDAPGFYKK